MVSPLEPRVIACGHLHFRSKLGNEFPALLICVPSDDGEIGYFWRAKRDFLLLDRSLRQNADALTSPFPKKAYTKLCNHAASDGGGPWVRPDDEHSPPGGYRCLVGTVLRKAGAPDTTIVCSNYDPRMKKSLFQLDSFLASAAQSTCSGVADAWSVFCRGEDSEGLTLASAARNVKGKKDAVTANAGLPATLGQYFASAENAKAVVSTVFSLLPEKTQICDVAFLEPSCGDGRIIEELLQSNEDLKSWNILGADVDAAAIEKAKQRLSGRDVALQCTDFLSLDREKLASELSFGETTTLAVLGGPPYTPKSLPGQFILHSIVDLRAELVVFILPKRCANVDTCVRIQTELNQDTTQGDREWCYQNTELENSLFSFEEQVVTQPSVLQSWHRGKPDPK